MEWLTLDDIPLAGKRILVRVDINVPILNGIVSDATRIKKIHRTINDILLAGGLPILLAHLGRPKGKATHDLSLNQLVPILENVLGRDVIFAADCKGPAAQVAVELLKADQVVLLENTRFYSAEEENRPFFAKEIASLGDVFCNDAFSAAHRAHASTVGIANILPSCAGRLMETELRTLETVLTAPKKPLVAVVGGAKVSTKLPLLTNLVEKVDQLIIGGGMANTFLVALGHIVGKSLIERDMTDAALAIMAKAKLANCQIILPCDIVVAFEFKAHAKTITCMVDQCPAEGIILDAGPNTVAKVRQTFQTARTLIWNGPLGAFEIEPFDLATNAAAVIAAGLTKRGQLISVAGGGDTIAALNKSGAAKHFSFISTAGGAFLEWMEGKILPGVAALNTK